MHITRTRIGILGFSWLMIALSGCTNWQEEYQRLSVQYENVKGRLERCQNEQQQLSNRVAQDSQLIEDLQRQIEEFDRTPADASGFGDEYDVTFDPAAGTVTVTLENTILFASGKASLKSATSSQLDHIVSVLKSKYAGKDVDVVGHTDTDPIKKSSWKDNWELSVQRALAVTRYLIDRGIPSERIRAAGCGEARPVASNASSTGKAKNRRVEIVVYVG